MIQPIRKQILFKPYESESVTAGGIIVPDSYKEPSNKGQVVAVGGMVKKLKKGDVAFRVKDWGTPIEENGEKYFIMEEDALLALN